MEALPPGGAEAFVCFRNAAGIYCSGLDRRIGAGILGEGTKVPLRMPGTEGAEQLSLGLRHFCFLRGGKVLCMGANDQHQLGTVAPGAFDAPIEVPGLSDIIELDAKGNRTCALERSGRVFCWGNYFDLPLRGAGVSELLFPEPIEHIAVGTYMSVGLVRGHMYWEGFSELLPYPGARCGQGSFHQEVRPFALPARAAAAEGHVVQVSLGDSTGCFLTDSHEVFCWGCNSQGEVGTGTVSTTTDQSVAPVSVATGILKLSRGTRSACGIDAGGRAHCWGLNNAGIIDGNQPEVALPVTAHRDLQKVRDIQVYWTHACATHEDGQIECWGAADCGQLGRASLEALSCQNKLHLTVPAPVDF